MHALHYHIRESSAVPNVNTHGGVDDVRRTGAATRIHHFSAGRTRPVSPLWTLLEDISTLELSTI